MSKKIGEWFKLNYRNVIIASLIVVPLLVSLISTIHVVNFFKLSNYTWLAVTLAVAFEVGALSSLAALAVMDKISKVSLWMIFILITLMQMMGNTYYAFDFITGKMVTQPQWTQNWIDLFSISSESIPATKRILAIVSGAILPVISLTFLHMLITYISKTKNKNEAFEYEEIYVDENGDPVYDEFEQPEILTQPEIEKIDVVKKNETNNKSKIVTTEKRKTQDIIENPEQNKILEHDLEQKPTTIVFNDSIKYNPTKDEIVEAPTRINLENKEINTIKVEMAPELTQTPIKIGGEVLNTQRDLVKHEFNFSNTSNNTTIDYTKKQEGLIPNETIQPESSNKSVSENVMPGKTLTETAMVKDTTFDDETQMECDNVTRVGIEELNEKKNPVAKKILLYKEKKN